jgi:hypothetical protein
MVWVFHGFSKAGTLKAKDHAQDCETLSAKIFAVSTSGDPAMVFIFRMASILPMVRASCPLHPAAGLRLDTPRGHFKIRAKKRAREMRA